MDIWAPIKELRMRYAFLIFLSLFIFSCSDDGGEDDNPGCPGGVLVEARDISDQSDCSFVLERKSDGQLLAIVNFEDFSEPIQDGADYIVITEQLLNTPTPCLGALLHQLFCIERT